MSNRLIYYKSPLRNVRHHAMLYGTNTDNPSIGPACQVICWTGHNHRLTLSRKGRLCKMCAKNDYSPSYDRRLREADFRIGGVPEVLCFDDVEDIWIT